VERLRDTYGRSEDVPSLDPPVLPNFIGIWIKDYIVYQPCIGVKRPQIF
jgi:hypothetical protein